jgi:hypothetical protein
MGFIIEEKVNPDFPVELSVVQREPHESTDPWRFISLRYDDFQSLTPRELRKLGRWLQQEGKRIGREYKSNGAPHAATAGREGAV